MKNAEQIPLFFEADPPPVELPYIGPGVEREEVAVRAGTVLDHRWTHPIEGYGRKGKLQHGLYDEKQRIFQTGGELSRFVYWKLHLVSFSHDAWQQVFMKTDRFEIVDHEKNECWAIAGERARNNAVLYEAGLGKRVGIPMRLWDVITSRGTIRQQGETE